MQFVVRCGGDVKSRCGDVMRCGICCGVKYAVMLTELYTQVPSLSRTHTHTHQTHYTHSLSVLHFCSLAV